MTVFMLSLCSDEYGLSGDSVLSESSAAAPRIMMANCDLKLEMEADSRRRRRGPGQGSRLLDLLSRRSLTGGGAVGGARLVQAAGLLPRHPATVASHTHKAGLTLCTCSKIFSVAKNIWPGILRAPLRAAGGHVRDGGAGLRDPAVLPH